MESNSPESEQNLQLIDKFKRLHEELVKLVDSFHPDKRATVLFNQWSLKDVLAHITAWNKIDTSGFQQATEGKEPILIFVPDDEMDDFNAKAVEQAKNLSWEEVYHNFVASGYELAKAAEQLPASKWITTIDPKKEISLRQDFGYSIDHYQGEHIPQLRSFLNA